MYAACLRSDYRAPFEEAAANPAVGVTDTGEGYDHAISCSGATTREKTISDVGGFVQEAEPQCDDANDLLCDPAPRSHAWAAHVAYLGSGDVSACHSDLGLRAPRWDVSGDHASGVSPGTVRGGGADEMISGLMS